MFQISLATFDDAATEKALDKVEELRNESLVDIEVRLHLWRSTLHIRRATIRDRSTAQILEQFPGYSDPTLVGYSIILALMLG